MKRIRMHYWTLPAFWGIVLMLLSSCGGGEVTMKATLVASSESERPAWIENTGKVNGEYIAVGFAEMAESESEGKQMATTQAKAELGRWIESEVVSELAIQMEAQESEELARRETTMKETIEIKSSIILKGISEKYVYWEKYEHGADTYYNYYVAVAISEADFNAIKNAAENALAAVEELERQGMELINQGQLGAGLSKLIQAARDAILLKKYQHKFGELLTVIKNVLDRVQFQKLNSGTLTGTLRGGLYEPLKIKMTYINEQGNTLNVVGTPLQVYIARDRYEAYENAPTTNNQGVVEIPVVRFENTGLIPGLVYLDLHKAMRDLLSTQHSEFRPMAAQLEEAIEDNGLEFQVNVESAQRGRVVLVVAEEAPSGAMTGNFAPEFTSQLVSQDIDVTDSGISATRFAGQSVGDIFNAIKDQFQDYDQAVIVTVTYSGNASPVRVNVRVAVYDLDTGRSVATANASQTRSGGSVEESYENGVSRLAGRQGVSLRLLQDWR